MTDFLKFKDAVQNKINEMTKGVVFQVNTNKDDIWDTYLNSFPEGTNPMFRENSEHDCNCCKQFIRNIGNMVALDKDLNMITVWDVEVDSFYQVVANALANYVRSNNIENVYLHPESTVGTDFNHERSDDGSVKRWEHFYCKLPNSIVIKDGSLQTKLGTSKTNKDVLERSLKELSLEASEVVLDLISQNSLYRGKEHEKTVRTLENHQKIFKNLPDEKKEPYLWKVSSELGNYSRFKTTVIGTLLEDISKGVDLEEAVRMFEAKVAPQNYKRSKSVITQKMVEAAYNKIEVLGLEDSLQRRFATQEDITINNVLFADRSAKKSMGILDAISSDISHTKPKLDKVQEITIEAFIKDVLPKAETVELMFENKHQSNLVSLVAPESGDAKALFKWGNNFSWSYNGEVTDSIKEVVKGFGGNIVADVRASLMWNEEGDNNYDFDLHATEPRGTHIYFGNKGTRYSSSGMLDVDIVNPSGKVAVENITWTNKSKMPDGEYHIDVNNFNRSTSKAGFKLELEILGESFTFEYTKPLRAKETIRVATIVKSKEGFKVVPKIYSQTSSKEVWNINTNKWNKVSMIMNSPNHWDGECTGNKHWFFILEGCTSPEPVRGFYNEFLKDSLVEHRKVFEVLASKLKTPYNEQQLSGVGFSETKSAEILCKVSGKFNRTLKIKI